MKLPVMCKVLKEDLDIQALRQAVLDVTEDVWFSDSFRKKVSNTANDTETIILKMNGTGTWCDNDPTVTKIWEDNWREWGPLITPVIDQVLPVYDGHEDAFVNKCLMPRLRTGMGIPPHIDILSSFDVSHRVHIPLITNPDVMFIIGGERHIMEEGKAYEINNKVMHTVINNGPAARTHLMFDVYIPKEHT